ncbi:hypothetical protein MKL26_04830 [Streptococcus suis]|nr:hypothetical protein [Streptococcus suis]
MVNKMYTDHERQKIAKEEYTNYAVDDPVKIYTDTNKGLVIGTVREVISDSTSLNGYVIEEPDGNITLLFQGFKGLEELDSKEDWLDHDF